MILLTFLTTKLLPRIRFLIKRAARGAGLRRRLACRPGSIAGAAPFSSRRMGNHAVPRSTLRNPRSCSTRLAERNLSAGSSNTAPRSVTRSHSATAFAPTASPFSANGRARSWEAGDFRPAQATAALQGLQPDPTDLQRVERQIFPVQVSAEHDRTRHGDDFVENRPPGKRGRAGAPQTSRMSLLR